MFVTRDPNLVEASQLLPLAKTEDIAEVARLRALQPELYPGCVSTA